jgi:hypothetical protein
MSAHRGGFLCAGLMALAGVMAAHRAEAQDTLAALYDPALGTIVLEARTANGDPAPLQVATFQFLSPAQYLSGQSAMIPASASSFFTILNTDDSPFFDPSLVAAEIYATNFQGPTPLFTGSWDLGPVAALGLSASQITSGFMTDPDVSPGGVSLGGSFLYQLQNEAGFQAGSITLVPEPGGMLLAGGIATVGLVALIRRRLQAIWRRRG